MSEVLAYSELPTPSARESQKMQCVATRRQSNRKLKTENLFCKTQGQFSIETPSIIKGFEVITSSSDKVRPITRNMYLGQQRLSST